MFSNENLSRKYFEELKWEENRYCPHCEDFGNCIACYVQYQSIPKKFI